jgi:DNA-binding transcriptional regulator YhcF (GntR family)
VTRKAGSLVINRLRDRIRLGRYFGRWSPGDRLPSVREVANLEEVDRKTAAAAYRRLQEEGLVRVEPRSGVYLEGDGAPDEGDPLRRLHQAWLERTLASAEELGLDSDMVNRMFQGVAAVERRRIPVVDPDDPHSALLARELSRRTGLDCVSVHPSRLPATVGPLRDPPFIVATPTGAAAVGALKGRVPIVPITLASELFEQVADAAREQPVLVLVGSGALREALEQALQRQLSPQRHPVTVQNPRTPTELEAAQDPEVRVLIWPGAPDWVGEAIPDGAQRPARLVADSTLEEIRSQVARAALDRISTSSASATRAGSASLHRSR